MKEEAIETAVKTVTENSRIQDKLVESFDKLLGWAEQSGEFVAEQTPLIAQEILQFEFWRHCVYAVLWGIVLTIMIVLARIIVKALTRDDCDDSLGGFFFGVLFFMSLMGIPIVFGLVNNIIQMLMISLAPRLFLLNYISDLFS